MIKNYFNTNVNFVSGEDYFVQDKFLFLTLSGSDKLKTSSYIEVLSSSYILGFPSCTIDLLKFNKCHDLGANNNFQSINTKKILYTNMDFRYFTNSNCKYPNNATVKDIHITDSNNVSYNTPVTLTRSTTGMTITGSQINRITFDDDSVTLLNTLTVLSSFLPSITALQSSRTVNTKLLSFEMSNCNISVSAFLNILKYFMANRWQYILPNSRYTSLPSLTGKLVFKNITGVDVTQYTSWFNYLAYNSTPLIDVGSQNVNHLYYTVTLS